MRDLKKNRQFMYYARLIGNEPVVIDDDGKELETGEYENIYDEPVLIYANISAAKGEAEDSVFGKELAYDRVIVISDPMFPIDEYTILWIDSKPPEAHDYIVSKVARSINSVSYAIKKVDMRH